MTSVLSIPAFEKYMMKYFEINVYSEVPKVVSDFFETRNNRFNDIQFHIEEASLNIVKVNIDNFIKKSKMKPSILDENKDDLEIYIFEYVKPYYQTYRNHRSEYAHAEMIYDLYVYSKSANDIVGYLEGRIGISDFKSYFQDAFIGMISVEKEYRQQKLAALMMRMSSSYIFYRRRKRLFSGTTISPDMVACCDNLSSKYKWIEHKPYFNNFSRDEQNRYLIHPIKFNVKVEDSDMILEF